MRCYFTCCVTAGSKKLSFHFISSTLQFPCYVHAPSITSMKKITLLCFLSKLLLHALKPLLSKIVLVNSSFSSPIIEGIHACFFLWLRTVWKALYWSFSLKNTACRPLWKDSQRRYFCDKRFPIAFFSVPSWKNRKVIFFKLNFLLDLVK